MKQEHLAGEPLRGLTYMLNGPLTRVVAVLMHLCTMSRTCNGYLLTAIDEIVTTYAVTERLD